MVLAGSLLCIIPEWITFAALIYLFFTQEAKTKTTVGVGVKTL